MEKTTKKAVILLSGGLDSATTLAIAKSKGFKCCAMTFRYGQRHSIEQKCASKIARFFEAEQLFFDINPAVFLHSALTDKSIKVPTNRKIDSSKIPITYVPARNTIFLSYALAFAESIGAFDIFIGVNATDYSGYPDCRPEYIKAYEKMANLATAAAIQKKGRRYKIHTPIIKMSKAQIIKTGTKLGVDYSLTHSCYNPDKTGKACGKCDSCQLRLKGFTEAKLIDPIRYAK
ncbi:MAG: 7-cyano-7-deazaguanine synthase QueC [Planctomycetes bacterium GWF2_41_51]|nr:MAG: 7-cyano-7-deazaguanine synthase QueC [Planctomycetes bacterium GWF2_41_51]HBG25766.1 7-cyano-7-deazaguanine synthase QueC [Phycisphaerales bacterium]